MRARVGVPGSHHLTGRDLNREDRKAREGNFKGKESASGSSYLLGEKNDPGEATLEEGMNRSGLMEESIIRLLPIERKL